MSTNLLAAGLGAFAVSEATGTTDLTAIGSGGDDGDDDENPLSRIPGFAPPGPNGGGPPAIDLSGLSIGGGGPSGTIDRVTEIVQVPTGGSGGGSDSGGDGGGGPSWQDILGTVEQGSLYDSDRFGGDDSGGSGSGSGSSGGGGVDSGTEAGLDLYNRITTPNDTFLGLAAGERTNDAVEGGGETVGGLPMRFLSGAYGGAIDAGNAQGDKSRKWIAKWTGAENDGEGVNAGRPGAGITDVLDMVASGEQGDPDETHTPTELPGAVYEDVKGRVSSSGSSSTTLYDGPTTTQRPDLNTGSGSSSTSSGSSSTSSGSSSTSSGSSSSNTTPDFSTSDSGTFSFDDAIGTEDPEDEPDEGSQSTVGFVR